MYTTHPTSLLQLTAIKGNLVVTSLTYKFLVTVIYNLLNSDKEFQSTQYKHKEKFAYAENALNKSDLL